jgi:hypothetical protein
LLPAINERKPGNAAPHYYRAIILQRQLPKEHLQQAVDNYSAWNEGPKETYPKEEVARWLEQQANVLAEIRKAAYKEHCHWDFRLQDIRGPEFYALLIPEIQACRDLARTLRVKARYEIFDGRPDDALETLRWGYQLARDAAQPLLVSGLVGVAISGVMNAELEHLIAESGNNYYWAIAGLPRPLVDLRPALEFELGSAFQVFPFLRDAETADRSPEEWRRLIIESFRTLGELGGATGRLPGWQGELAAAALMTKLYPAAKEELIAAGMDQQKVEAMPAAQVVAIQTTRVTESTYHDIFKLSLLPYHEAVERLPAMMQRLEKDVLRPDAALSGKGGLPITGLLLPAVEAVLRADVRAARNIAVLQAIEAIRMHAADHGGQLPDSLADITVVPVPKNPATGESFPYKIDAARGAAILEVPTLEGYQPRHDGKRYVIRIKE